MPTVPNLLPAHIFSVCNTYRNDIVFMIGGGGVPVPFRVPGSSTVNGRRVDLVGIQFRDGGTAWSTIVIFDWSTPSIGVPRHIR